MRSKIGPFPFGINNRRDETDLSVRIERLTRHPTMRRANTSTTNATYTQPCQVET